MTNEEFFEAFLSVKSALESQYEDMDDMIIGRVTKMLLSTGWTFEPSANQKL